MASRTRNWKAWENRQPGNPRGPVLHVNGEVETVNGGIKPVLTERSPQGINTKILLLDLTLEDTGHGTTEVAFRPVRFEKAVAKGEHTSVEIMEDGNSIANIDVEIVQ